jgi:hypothetical protein
MELAKTIAFWIVMAELIIILITVFAWPIGQRRERRQMRRLDSDIAEFERQYRERSGG